MNDTKGLVEEILVCLGNERAYREIIGAKKEDNPDWIDLLECALTALKSNGWQPIESCPDDYSEVLFFIGGRTVNGRFMKRKDGNIWEINGTSAHEKLMRQLMRPIPTHWMPLPQPPKEPNNKEEA